MEELPKSPNVVAIQKYGEERWRGRQKIKRQRQKHIADAGVCVCEGEA